MGNHAALQSAAESLDIPIAEVPDHPDWRQEADRLVAAGEAILSDKEAYGVHLDHILIGDTRLEMGALGPSRGDPAGQRHHPRERCNRNPGAAFPGANARRECARSPKQGPRVPPASVGRLPRIGGRAHSSTEGVRRLSSTRVQTLHHTRGQTVATPATYMKRPNNSPPRRKRTRSAGAKPKARPTSSAGFNRPRTTQRGTSA